MTDHETSDEQFLGRLAAADPVDPATLPSAQSPAAGELLSTIVSDPSAEPARPGEPFVTAAPAPGPGQRSEPVGLLARGRGALVAVAAAVLLLVGAVVVLAPDNTPAAVAEVHDAAAVTADSDTGRIETSFVVSFDEGGRSDTVGGLVEVVYADGDLGLSVRIDDLPADVGSEAGQFLPALDDIRLVDDVAYIQRDGQWLAVDTGGLLGDLVVRYVDPRAVLDTVQTLTEATEVGPADVGGVATTQYRSVVDLGDQTLAQSGWLAFDGMDVEADGEVTVDLFVDGSGALHRFDLSGQVRPADGTDGQADFEVTTTFTDTGSDLSIEAPEGAVAFDPMLGGFDQDE